MDPDSISALGGLNLPCHDDVRPRMSHDNPSMPTLTHLQSEALAKLRPFIELHGAQRLSRRLHELRRFDIANAVEYAFRSSDSRESALSRAVHVLGFTYEPACDHSTTYEEDLAILHELYLTGASLTEAVMKRRADHSRLFNRAKKRSKSRPGGTGSWADVFHDMVQMFGPLAWDRFLTKLPPGLFELPDGEVLFFRGSWQGQNQRALFIEVVKRLHEAGYPLSPSTMKQHPATAKILGRISERGADYGYNYGDVVAEATGRPYEEAIKTKTGAKVYLPSLHVMARHGLREAVVSHCRLPSVPELVVDEALSMLVGQDEYERRHAHDLQYAILLKTPSMELVALDLGVDCPYRGTHSPRCDIAIFGDAAVVVVEILGGLEDDTPDLARAEDYEAKIRWKKACIEAMGAGFVFVPLSWDTGGWDQLAVDLERLVPVLRAASVPLPPKMAPIREMLGVVASSAGRQAEYFSLDEAKAHLLQRGIVRWPDYQEECKSEPRLPSNPDRVYRTSGWKGQPDLFKAAREAKRQGPS